MKKKLLISILLIVTVIATLVGTSYAALTRPNVWEQYGQRHEQADRVIELREKIKNGTATKAEIDEFDRITGEINKGDSTTGTNTGSEAGSNTGTNNEGNTGNSTGSNQGTTVDTSEEEALRKKYEELDRQRRDLEYNNSEVPAELHKELNETSQKLYEIEKAKEGYAGDKIEWDDSKVSLFELGQRAKSGQITEEELKQYLEDGSINEAAYNHLRDERLIYLQDKERRANRGQGDSLTNNEQEEIEKIRQERGTSASSGSSSSSSGSYQNSVGKITSTSTNQLFRLEFERIASGTYIGLDETYGGIIVDVLKDKQIFCNQHGAYLDDFHGHQVVPGIGPDVIDPTGTVIEINTDPGDIPNTKTPAKYDVVAEKVAGKDGEWAIAYVLSMIKENEGDRGLPPQEAYWQLKGQESGQNAIAKEALAFEDYKKRLQADGGFKPKDEIEKNQVAFTIAGDQIIVGPLRLHYQRGFANESGRQKVEFGGIGIDDGNGNISFDGAIKIYDQTGKEIPQSTWKITYDREHMDSSKQSQKSNDSNYGTTGLDGFFYYPYSDEEFNIVIKFTGNEDVSEIGKIVVNYFDTDYITTYQELKGKCKNIAWDKEPIEGTCNDGYVDEYVECYCVHGYLSEHTTIEGYRITARVAEEIDTQDLVVVANTQKIRYRYNYTIEPPSNTTVIPPEAPPYTRIPPITPIYPTYWPSIPIWPTPTPPTPTPPTPPTPPVPTAPELTIRLSGIVWEDVQTGKESESDGLIGKKNDGSNEDGIANVKVTLYKYGTKELAKAIQNPVYTNSAGAYYFSRVPMGKYDVEFEYDGMTYSTVKAYANGSVQDYINNPQDEKYNSAAKTEETTADRENFNEKFYEITGDSSKVSSGGKSFGLAKDRSGNVTANLEYDTANGVSTLITKQNNGVVRPEFALTAKTSVVGDTGAAIGYPFYEKFVNDENDKLIDGKTYEANYPYMYFINLGLKKRPETDLAVMKDVEKATVTINKKQLNYKYNARAGLDGFDLTVREQPNYSNIRYNREIYKSDYNYRIDDYKLNNLNDETITYAELQGILGNKDVTKDELKVFVTYKMTIRNQSGIPAMAVNELVDYFDSTYKLVGTNNSTNEEPEVYLDIYNKDGNLQKDKLVGRKSYFETSSGKYSGNINWQVTNTNVGKYKKMYTKDLKDVILESGEDIYIYVTFEVSHEDVNRSLNLGEKGNYMEISSYSTYNSGATSSNDKAYGKIERDSAPGNLDITSQEKMEDDSDSAPIINIHIDEPLERTVNGIVWEDERTNKISQTGQIVGNGLKEANEKEIDGVRVQLIELIDNPNGGASYEYIWQEMRSGESGYKFVDSNGIVNTITEDNVASGTTDVSIGGYKFKNYIPGNYILRFKYGEDEKTIDPSRHDGISYNGHDFKSTAYQLGDLGRINAEWYDLSSADLNNTRMSDAKDNEARRLQVMNYSKVMKNAMGEILYAPENSKTELYKELADNTWMYADTAKLKIEVEYNKTEASGLEAAGYDGYNVRDIDFGLEQRPRNDMKFSKEITGIKITLADGNVIVDTANGVRKNVQHNKDRNAKGFYNIAVDEEVMQGMIVQISYKMTVENTGEIDTTGANGGVGTTYYTGKYSSSDKIVTTSYDSILDFVDNSIVFRPDDNPDWKQVNIDDLKRDGLLNSESKIVKIERDETGKLVEKPVTQVIVNESLKGQNITPGEERSVELTLSKTVSALDRADDLSYDNIAEVIQFTNLVGRKAYIPGNSTPSDVPSNSSEKKPDNVEPDTDFTEVVTITPPTGANKSTTFLLVGAAVLAVVAGGIVIAIYRRKK